MSRFYPRALFGALFAVSAFSASAHDMSAHTELAMPSTASWQGEGIIRKVTPTAVTIAHHPIPALNWPAMTMQFAQPVSHPLTAQSVGEEVDFTFIEGDAGYQIVSVNPHR